MGAVQHEEAANTGAIPGCNQGAGYWAADNRNSKGRTGGRLKAVGFRDSARSAAAGDASSDRRKTALRDEGRRFIVEFCARCDRR